MKTERREKIVDVFNSVLELSHKEQTVFLNEKLGDDKTAIDEIRELLISHGEANDFMEDSPAIVANENLSGEIDSKPLEQIGVYKIEKQIGLGGMGRVYLASRADNSLSKKLR